jgi:hypothetical protein
MRVDLPTNWHWLVIGFGLLIGGVIWGWSGLSSGGNIESGPETGLGATREQVARELRREQREAED